MALLILISILLGGSPQSARAFWTGCPGSFGSDPLRAPWLDQVEQASGVVILNLSKAETQVRRQVESQLLLAQAFTLRKYVDLDLSQVTLGQAYQALYASLRKMFPAEVGLYDSRHSVQMNLDRAFRRVISAHGFTAESPLVLLMRGYDPAENAKDVNLLIWGKSFVKDARISGDPLALKFIFTTVHPRTTWTRPEDSPALGTIIEF